MHISKIIIENFKCIEKLEIDVNENFNVIIGENNQGKSTIFEALQFWYRCYHLFIRYKNKYLFYKRGIKYIPFRDLDFLRYWQDSDIFYKNSKGSIITVVIRAGSSDYKLGFNINKPKAINDSYLKVNMVSYLPFEQFANILSASGIALDKAIFLYETSPMSRILTEEPFMTRGQIKKKVMLGKSQDVLRNKIVKHNALPTLNQQVSKVMGSEFKFHYENKQNQENEEYIDLQVESGGKKHELHMQGSGLLQIIEIFATLDYAAAELNILLIDEPDSHTHMVLQKRLMESLRGLTDNQTFIISHNDAFVGQCNNGELYYLNNEAKSRQKLEALEDFDLIKKDFGSPIMALQQLNEAGQVVFVEGTDDTKNMKLLLAKYQEAGLVPAADTPAICQFFQIRGKDNLVTKMDHNRRTLSQLFRDKKYVVVTDKDFTTLQDSQELNNSVKAKLGATAEALCHDGYCMESILFSDLDILYQYLAHKSGESEAGIRTVAEAYLDNLQRDLKDVSTQEYRLMKTKFTSQKNGRAELANTDFDEVMADVTQSRETLRFIMNKGQIRKFIEHLETDFVIPLVPRTPADTDEAFCETLFQDYINSIPTHGLLYTNHKETLNKVFNLQIV